jgi:hypothetical protein
MKNIIIFQILPDWVDIIKDAIEQASLEITPNISYPSTLDECLELVPKEGELLVICNSTFHGVDSSYEKNVDGKTEKCFKNADDLAFSIKKINKKAKVWVYSERPPKTILYINGFIHKNGFRYDGIKNVINLIKNY